MFVLDVCVKIALTDNAAATALHCKNNREELAFVRPGELTALSGWQQSRSDGYLPRHRPVAQLEHSMANSGNNAGHLAP